MRETDSERVRVCEREPTPEKEGEIGLCERKKRRGNNVKGLKDTLDAWYTFVKFGGGGPLVSPNRLRHQIGAQNLPHSFCAANRFENGAAHPATSRVTSGSYSQKQERE